MGTNYEWKSDICDKCGRPSETLHIGKQSAGWDFLFRAHPDRDPPILRFCDWLREFSDGGTIEDEYGREVILTVFLRDVLQSYVNPKMHHDTDASINVDGDGFCFWEREFS